MLTKFLDFLSQNAPSVLISYSCTNFDKRVLESALQRHNLDGYQQFNNIPHVDLGSKLARCFALPIKKRKVKDVGSWLDFQFKQRNLSGIQVANEYDAHIRERRPLNPSAFEYNEDDVRVLAHIVQRLSEFAESPSVGL